MKKVLILGNGLLGTELQKQTGWDIISRRDNGFDITDKSTYHLMTKIEHGVIQYCPYDVIINTIAHTDTYSDNRESHWNTNYKGTAELVDFCNSWKIKLVQISTDYIYAGSMEYAAEHDVPVHCPTWYGYTKLLSDAHVQLACNDHLCIRSTHKATPFQYEAAWQDQKGNFDYVDVIASIIVKLIHKDVSGVINVGTESKTMYDLAKKTRPDVKINITKQKATPTDVTMNLSKLEEILK